MPKIQKPPGSSKWAPGGREEEEEALLLSTTDRVQGFTTNKTVVIPGLVLPIVLLLLALAGAVRASSIPPSGVTTPAEEALPDSEIQEHWYRIDIGQASAGWMLLRETRQGDRLSSVSILHLRFKRGSSEQTLELESRFVETLDGRPLSAWARQDLGSKPVETSWELERGTVWVEVTRDGETERERMPWPPGDWLTPGQLQRRLRQLLASGAETFTLTGLDPQLGLEPIDTEWRLDERQDRIVLDGQPRAAMRFRQRQALTPQLETVAHVDSEGLLLRSVTPMMGLEMTLSLSTKEDALAQRETPELLRSSFLYPDRPIPNPRKSRRVLYEIATENGALGSLPSIGNQRVFRAQGSYRILVELGSSPTLGDDERPDPTEYLSISTFLDHQDPVIQKLMGEIEIPAAGAAARAEALRGFVANHLSDKNLDSSLATASEVAASGSGDCTEHSVLLAALLRAAGIPARVVTGIVYVEELLGQRHLFGYHMWTQALIDDRWIDLDATLDQPFDAAHIALGTSALNDGSSTLHELAKLATLIGAARIRVLEVEH